MSCWHWLAERAATGETDEEVDIWLAIAVWEIDEELDTWLAIAGWEEDEDLLPTVFIRDL